MRDMRLSRRLYIGFGLLVGLLLLTAATALVQASIMRQATDQLVNGAIPLRAVSLRLQQDMLNEETAVRGYVITYDEAYLEPYQQGHEAAAGDLARLKALAAASPALQDDANQLAAQVGRVEQVHQDLIDRVRAGDLAGASTRIGDGKTAFDQLRVASGKLLQVANQAVAQADQRSTDAAKRMQLSMAILAALSLLFAAAAAITLGRDVNRRLVQAISETATSASQISSATTEQEQIASEQASAISEVASTVEQLNTVAQESASRAREVANESREALEAAQRGAEAMNRNLAQMSSVKASVEDMAGKVLALSEQNNQIGVILGLIDDIAFQTNLLALNAAVEAARAGEQGKGFAVLAAEIRKLAEQSKSATVQIGELVKSIERATNSTVMMAEQSTKAVDSGVKLTQEVGEIIQGLGRTVEETVTAVSDIAISSQQQLLGSQQIAQAMSSINLNMRQMLAGVSQTQASILSLNGMAADLQKLV